MLQIDRVLHATDFSPASRAAMAYSVILARLLGVRVDVLHVMSSIGPPTIAEYDPEAVQVEAVKDGFAGLARMAEGTGTDIRFLLGKGPLPGPVILEEAMESGANLIVLGAHGGGAAEVDKLGSVSTDIVRRSTCPVLIIPPHVEEASVDERMERVATVISYSRRVAPVIVVASEIARLLGAKLEVLAQLDGVDKDGETWEGESSKLTTILDRLRGRGIVALPSDRVELHPIGTSEVDDVLEFTRTCHSDMLILEAPGLASMDSPIEQNVEELVGRAPCPVMLINTCGRELGTENAIPESEAETPAAAAT